MSFDSEYIFTFGKHKGELLNEVPAKYLLWLYDQDWLEDSHPDLYDYIQENYQHLEREK